jgi:maleylacetate reductase
MIETRRVAMKDFVYEARPGRIVFGAGAWRRIEEEVERLAASRVLIATSRSNRACAEELAERLGGRCAGVPDDARPHVPIAQAQAARARARESGADALVAVGGGTPIGLAKAIAYETGAPIVAVPTTYSGSEMTALVGITRDGVKRTVASPAILPRAVVYDPELTFDLPAAATAGTGMNAIAHCVEALYVPSANPVSSMLAEAGLAALARGLPGSVETHDAEARGEALYGAYLAGAALGATGIALHHKLCHVLGGTYGLGHGDSNAVILPHAVHFNAPAAGDAIARAARALGAGDADAAAPFLYDFAERIGAPTSLSALGLDHDVLDEAARIAVGLITDNPRPVSAEDLRALLEDAWHGRRPGA